MGVSVTSKSSRNRFRITTVDTAMTGEGGHRA
jgi:hypothetical protein